jgi:hypothetical protein
MIPLEKTMRDLSSQYNIKTEEMGDDKQDVDKAIDDLRNKFMSMMP